MTTSQHTPGLGRKCEFCGKLNGVTKFRVSKNERVTMHPKCFRLWQTGKTPISNERIVEIRDDHLPSQGDPFDCIAFARAIEAESYLRTNASPDATGPNLLAVLQSVRDWCYPNAEEIPNDPLARCEWYSRRLLLVANAARAAISKATGA